MQGLSFDELISKYRYPLLVLLGGLILTGVGILFVKTGFNFSGDKVEILSGQNNSTAAGQIEGFGLTVEIGGSVVKPGVYKLPGGSRIDDLLVLAGGFSGGADRNWSDKYLNRAAYLADGQKVYIPKVGEQTLGASAKTATGDQNASLININTASTSQLDSLPGIGPVYAQKIIEQRPYSTLEELVSKGAIKQSVFDKIKDKITIY
ncbi:MAG: ComEA family DNA-binding protein [bacterium]|nr:ComEA family DNA-binding protein [bacterium]